MLGYPFQPTVTIKPPFRSKAANGNAQLFRKRNGKARWCAHCGDYPDARHRCLLNKLKAGSAAE
jgi:hypothetical protein